MFLVHEMTLNPLCMLVRIRVVLCVVWNRAGRCCRITHLLTAFQSVDLLKLLTCSRQALTHGGLLQVQHLGNLADREIADDGEQQAFAQIDRQAGHSTLYDVSFSDQFGGVATGSSSITAGLHRSGIIVELIVPTFSLLGMLALPSLSHA